MGLSFFSCAYNLFSVCAVFLDLYYHKPYVRARELLYPYRSESNPLDIYPSYIVHPQWKTLRIFFFGIEVFKI